MPFISPCGQLLLGVHNNSVCLCDWMMAGRSEKTLRRIKKRFVFDKGTDSFRVLDLVEKQLDEYFKGERTEFDLPLMPIGTEFQERVWNVLHNIEYGYTTTYKAIAESLFCVNSVRAVANAIGANPLSILIPCHRIIGANGSLTGYAGGLEAKAYLLDLERNRI